MIEQTMKWIKSGGGPLICVNENLAGFWRGTVASSRPNSKNEQTTDYNRACSTGDYVAEIETSGGKALILGDMPLETSVLSRRRTTILRLFYADADANFVDIIDKISDEYFLNPIETVFCQIHAGRMLIFDSALDGLDHIHESLTFDMACGLYEILTITVKPDDRTSLLLHRFFRLN